MGLYMVNCIKYHWWIISLMVEILQCEAPKRDACWFITPVPIVTSTNLAIVIVDINQLSYLGGLTLYK